MTKLLEGYTRWVLTHPWLTMLLGLMVVAAASTGLSRIGFTTDYRVYFGEDNPELAAFEAMEDDFVRSEVVLIGVEPLDGEVFSVDTLKALKTMTAAAEKLPYARAAYSITNVYQARAEGDDITAEQMMPSGPVEEIDMAAFKKLAMSNTRLRNGLLAANGDVTGLVVYIELPHENPQAEIEAVATASRALAEQTQAEHPNLRFHLSGVVMFNEALSEAIRLDGKNLYPLAYLVMFALLVVFFRNISSMVSTLVVVLMAVVTALGLAGWLGIQLNTTSIASGIIILTLGIADCVHLLTTFTHERQLGMDKRTAMAESLRINFQPIFLTSLTTALGFLGMNFSDSPPNHDLGNIVAIGVVAAWLASVSFLPAFMQVIPLGKPREQVRIQHWMEALAEWVIRHRRALFIGNFLVIIGLAACIPLNSFGDNYVEYFDKDIQFRKDAEFINERLMGQQVLEYPIPAAEPGGVNDPEFLNHLAALVAWFEQQPETRKASSVINLMKNLNQTMNGGAEDQHRLPATREEAAQYLFFYEMSLPAGVDLSHLVNMDKSAAKLTVMLDTITSEELIALDERARAWMADNLPDYMYTRASSISVLFAHIARRNFSSMIIGTGLAFLLISLLLLMAFRSLRLGFISLVPNLVPAIMGFGIWGLLVGKVGMSLSVVVSLTLGIVVDDTVHLLSKYRRARVERGLSAEDAIRYAFSSVGMALWITSVVLVVGFSITMASSFMLTVHMGALTAIIIACALFADFLFLPPLLMGLDRDKVAEPVAEDEALARS